MNRYKDDRDISDYKTSLNEAKEVGDTLYFPKKPCARGHLGLRLVKNSECFVCYRMRRRKEELPPLRNKYGVGYNSSPRKGYSTTVDGKCSQCYGQWSRMLQRAYDQKYKELHPTYRDVFVDTSWHDYQNFADWYYKQKEKFLGFYLDKYLLVTGNKMYSESTVCLLPQKLNKKISIFGKVWHKDSYGYSFVAHGKHLGYSKDDILAFADEVVTYKNQELQNCVDLYLDILNERTIKALRNFCFKYRSDGSIYRGSIDG